MITSMHITRAETLIVAVTFCCSGLYPHDIKEAARAEMVVDGTLDLLGKYFAAALFKTISVCFIMSVSVHVRVCVLLFFLLCHYLFHFSIFIAKFEDCYVIMCAL